MTVKFKTFRVETGEEAQAEIGTIVARECTDTDWLPVGVIQSWQTCSVYLILEQEVPDEAPPLAPGVGGMELPDGH